MDRPQGCFTMTSDNSGKRARGGPDPVAAGPAGGGEEGDSAAQVWADKRIFTTGEAAEVCKVSQQTIIRCFDSGRLGGFRVPGSKFRRIPRNDLIKFMRDNEIPTEVLDVSSAKRVLIVDDDPNILEVFSDLLGRDPRFEVRTCATGYEAGMLTEAFRPHVMVLDYMLPDMNGDVVCRRVRERDELAGTKIIFVSGVVAPEEIDRLMKAGADEFVRKPFDVRMFMAKLEKLAGV
jgi:excisionase family DNA binding protein